MSVSPRSLVLVALLSTALPLSACGDSKLAATSSLEAIGSDPTSCQEQHPDGVVAFVVAPDGTVRAGATGVDGQPAKIEGGTLTFRKDGAAPTEAKLTPEGDGTVATAKGPAMDADVTAVDYVVQVAGKTLNGVLHLPSGGTKLLADTTRTAAADEAAGPNGGQVQMVGGEPVEVAVAPSGDVVAYVLDPSKKTVVTTTADRTIWVLVDGEKVALAPRADGAYVGRTTVLQPRKVSVVVVREGKHHVVVVGHRPGVKVVASRAPGKVVVANLVLPARDVDVRGDANAKGGSGSDDGDEGGRGRSKDKDNNGLGNDKPGTPGYKGDKDVGNGAGKGGGDDKGGKGDDKRGGKGNGKK